MKTKRAERLVACIIATIMAIVLACGIAFGMGLQALAQSEASPSVFTGYSANLTEKQLYDETNTYSYEGNPYSADSNAEEFRKYNDYYNMNIRQSNNVVSDSAPQITVITHGLGGNASHWSNDSLNVEWKPFGSDVPDGEKTFNFAYSEDSVMSRIESELLGEGNVNLYWAKMATHDSFYLVDLKDPANINPDGTYRSPDTTNVKTIDNLQDVSKHIIVVFEAFRDEKNKIYSANDYNNIVYEEFNYVLSKIIYDVKLLSGNQLPRINLIGHSRGGITNLQYALDHPDLVAGLYSMGTPYFGTDTGSTDLGASVVGGMSHGLEDIIDRSIYVPYYDRWNSGYELLYKNIDTYALGGYSDSDFVFDALINDKFGVVSGVVSPEALEVIKWGVKSLGGLVDNLSSSARAIDWLISLFRDVEYDEADLESYIQILGDITYWGNEYTDFWDKLVHVIPVVGCPYFMNDLLVNLSSQIGEDEHSDTYRSYGFNTYVKEFTSEDYLDNGKIRISSPMPTVVHNLEAQDNDLITKIIEVIDVGALQSKYMYQKQNDGTIVITGMIGDMSENSVLAIPETIDGYKVIGIGQNAFATLLDRYDIKTVTIPDNVKEIGDGAFSGCTKLEKVNIADSGNLTKLGDYCFSGCTNLNNISLPDALQEIGVGAFYKCTSLFSIELGAKISTIGVGVFWDCDNLSDIIVSASNQNYSANDGMLMSKDKTTLLSYSSENGTPELFVVPDTVTTISQYAFYGNESIVSVDLANVTTIREGAFADCVNLDVVLSEEADIIEGFAFAGTKWYESNEDFAVIGNVVYSCLGEETDVDFSGYFSISPYAAFGNSNIETITFNNAARNIGAFAFAGCENLDTVYLNNLNDLVYVGTSSFDNTADNFIVYLPQRVLEEYTGNELWQQYADSFAVHTTSVNYDLNGGNIDGQTAFTATAAYGGYVSLPEPVRTGYTFEGWYESEDFSGQKLDANSLWTSYAADGNLYAKWAPLNYTIIYNLNGGSMDSPAIQTYTIEDAVQFPVPQMEGYTFAGWYTDAGLTKPAGDSFAAGRTGDITLYAKWEPNEYTVTYNYNLNTGETLQGSYPVNTTVTYDQKYSMVVPERFGYEFNGWRDADGTFYSNENGAATFNSWNVAEDITLYADWTLVYYQLQIDDDGIIYWVNPDGSISKVESQIPGNVTLSILDIIENFRRTARNLRVGHKFAYFVDESGNEITSLSKYLIEIQTGGTISFEAHYEKEQNFTLDFISYPTDPGSNPFVGEYGTAIKYLTVSKVGYTFKHWKVADVDENDIYVGTTLAPGTIFDYDTMPDLSINREADGEHIYLEAYFEPNEYTISLYSNYGNLSPSKVFVDYDSKVALPVLSATGRTFNGWYTSSTGGTEIAGADGVMNVAWTYTSNKSLYAHWSTITYTIDYRFVDRDGKIISSVAGGYTNNNPKQFDVDDLDITLKDAVFDDYIFMGWYNLCQIEDENEVKSITSVGNIVLYGYIEKIYTISFNVNGGSSVSAIQGIEGQEITLPSPTKYKFKGTWKYWGYLTGDSSVSNFGHSYTIGPVNETLDAVWKQYIFKVTFDKNGGSGGTTSKTVTYGELLPYITLPTRTAHNFLGYYTSASGGTCYYDFYDAGLPTSYYYNYYAKECDFARNITLYARWEQMSWSVSVNLNLDGLRTYEETIELTYNQQKTYRVPVIVDYVLDRWVLSSTFATVATGTSETIDLTNKCIGNYDSYQLTIIYTYSEGANACIASGTFITLADGSQKPVELLTGNEMLLVWNMYTGTFDSAPILCIDSDPLSLYEVIRLSFSDGTIVNVISEHGFFDVDLNKYVYLDEHAADYIGHCFLKQGANGMAQVTLEDVTIVQESTTAYSPVTYGHLCYFVNGMLSMPGGIDGLFNIFEVDPETMTYDAEAMAADIEKYGLYTYEELNALVPVPEVMFDAVNGQYLKVAVGKGIITTEQIGELVERYADLFE